MLNNSYVNRGAARIVDASFNASRQVLLAGLGAVTMTRDWAQSEARDIFRSFVQRGAAVEAHALRIIGEQVASTISTATSIVDNVRNSVLASVKGVSQFTGNALSSADVFAPRQSPKRVRRVQTSATKARV